MEAWHKKTGAGLKGNPLAKSETTAAYELREQ